MSKQTINIGASPNDGTGTPLRTSFDYTNQNFTELYTAVGPSGNNIVVPGNATITGDLTVDTSTLKVDATNNRVGIGTASPTVPLEVAGAATITGALTVGNGTSATQTFSGVTNILDIGYGSLRGGSAYGDVRLWTDRFRIYNNAGTQIIKNISGTNGDETWYDGAGGTRMTLNSTGLGIGGSPNTGFLTVGAITNASATTNAVSILSTRATLIITANGATDAAGTTINYAWVNNGQGPLIFRNAAIANVMTLDASGNVGIGNTPTTAWRADARALQVGVSKYVSLHEQSNGSTNLAFSNYESAANVFSYTTGDAPSRYAQINGAHQWYSAAAGTINTVITFGDPKMTLDTSGNLLVGKTSTSLTPVGVIAQANGVTISTLAGSTDGTETSVVYSNGAGAYRFYVGMAGTVFATNTVISAISDARYKENVQDIDVGLAAILALKPRKFDWKAGKGKDIKGDRGFIAQEFETVFPNLIDEWKDPAPEGEAPYKSVRQDLIPVLVKAIQELTARVQTLEAR